MYFCHGRNALNPHSKLKPNVCVFFFLLTCDSSGRLILFLFFHLRFSSIESRCMRVYFVCLIVLRIRCSTYSNQITVYTVQNSLFARRLFNCVLTSIHHNVHLAQWRMNSGRFKLFSHRSICHLFFKGIGLETIIYLWRFTNETSLFTDKRWPHTTRSMSEHESPVAATILHTY